MGQAERVSHRQHPLPDVDVIGVAKFRGGQLRCFDFDDGKVGFFVGTDHLGFKSAIVGKGDGQVGSTLDDVIVGDDESVGADDQAGSQSALHVLFAVGVGVEAISEEPLEQIVAEGSARGWVLSRQGQPLNLIVDRDFANRADIDDRGVDGLGDFLKRGGQIAGVFQLIAGGDGLPAFESVSRSADQIGPDLADGERYRCDENAINKYTWGLHNLLSPYL